jgi:hypothetical protein
MCEEQARFHLSVDFSSVEIEKWEDRNHIKNYVDVLYYADAFGDLEDAILLQAFDKTLPDRVYKGLLDSGMDIYEAVNCHELEAKHCPGCDTGMWEIEISQGDGYTSHDWVDEYGNTNDWVDFVENPEGRYWNADSEDNDSPVLCWACAHDVHHDFPRTLRDKGSVVVHYGETGEVSAFSVWNGLVRWEFEGRGGRNSNWTDLWGLPGEEADFPAAFATGNAVSHLNGLGWSEIAEDQVMDAFADPGGSRARRREYRRLADEWAEGEEAHPDLGFTYLIENATFGNPSFWVADENREELMNEITDLIDRRI